MVKIAGNDLDKVFNRARSYKESVLRKWIDNLSAYVLRGETTMKAEALRRIDYLESLIGGKP